MATDRGQLHGVITTGGTDGACAAACVLMRHGEGAPVHITSQNHVHRALQRQTHLEPRPGVIHVCGVGIADNLTQVIAQLRELGRQKIRVIWYCGRGYLAPQQAELERVCQTVFEKARSNTELLAHKLKVAEHEQAPLLIKLAQEYVEKKPPTREHQFYHDLVQLASHRYFQFGDEEPFLRALVKLIGALPISERDRKEVEAYVKGGKKQKVALGTSPAMARLREMVKRIAPLDEPVLILGPSGAGKELVARALHDGSQRSQAPFVPINCAILGTNADLAYDRLFGHAAEAYTGARTASIGAFEKADGGTLFLDEVAELPLEIQTQLLRVLEDRAILPHGTMEERAVDVRIIAATNRDLPALVRGGGFRLDLYYRLHVLTVEVPALRDRLEDVKSILTSVQRELAEGGTPLVVSARDREAIQGYHWPGNVRQLISVLKRAALTGMSVAEAVSQERRLGAEEPHCAEPTGGPDGLFLPRTEAEILPLDEVSRRYVKHSFALLENKTQAARALGVAPNTLRAWLGPKP